MKDKGILSLIELIMMLLVFALAAALCLKAFALSDRLSDDNRDLDHAVIQAQNAAEALQYCGGDTQLASSRYGGVAHSDSWVLTYDGDWNMTTGQAAFTLTAEITRSAALGRADLRVEDADGTLIFSMPVAWQEVGK